MSLTGALNPQLSRYKALLHAITHVIFPATRRLCSGYDPLVRQPRVGQWSPGVCGLTPPLTRPLTTAFVFHIIIQTFTPCFRLWNKQHGEHGEHRRAARRAPPCGTESTAGRAPCEPRPPPPPPLPRYSSPRLLTQPPGPASTTAHFNGRCVRRSCVRVRYISCVCVCVCVCVRGV